ncbi:unnamed protein product, partial [marine sediment metagenome]
MERIEIETIGKERLDKWQQRLIDEHATPVILVGVGHDHRSGQVVVYIPE